MMNRTNPFRCLLQGRLWRDLWREIQEDDCWGMAAQMSYYFLLGFFPFLLFLSSLIGFVPVDPNLLEKILGELRLFLPKSTYDSVQAIANRLLASGDKHLLAVGISMALWFVTLGFNSMVGVLNRAYDLEDRRSYLRVHAVSMGVTVVVSLFVIISGVLLFFGDDLTELLFLHLPLVASSPLWFLLNTFYSVLRWILIFALLNMGAQFVYFALPARRPPWRFLSPGSTFAALGGIVGSKLFAFFVNNFSSYQQIYGNLTTMIVLMIWFYLSSFVLLVGAEIDSEIHRLQQQETSWEKRDERAGAGDLGSP